MTKIDNPVSGYHFATKHVFLQSMYVAHRVSEEMAKRSSSPFGESSVKIVHLVLKISTCFIKFIFGHLHCFLLDVLMYKRTKSVSTKTCLSLLQAT